MARIALFITKKHLMLALFSLISLEVNTLLGFEFTDPVLNTKLLEPDGVPAIMLFKKGFW